MADNISWCLKTLRIDELKPYKSNPRSLRKDQALALSCSLDKFGLIDKPVVNLNNTIIGGHQRIEILKSKKIERIECWIPDRLLDEQEIKELNIRLNKNSGSWDFELLANTFEPIELMQWGFSEFDLGLDTKEASETTKAVKHRVILEFSDAELMTEYLPTIQWIAEEACCKLKVK